MYDGNVIACGDDRLGSRGEGDGWSIAFTPCSLEFGR
jgi:hypothetical protein